ncbi:UDP-N-acetylmuramoyl-tripeptide--D-alanyl-D-alanine ligase [Tropheryma whipplei]|uniref:UDP-N-acetylmuramoyl-tripeptide--D-alanyl-D- alanine ligase n=1 Tax=Tropheryma whipplei TaxID=2039 RepID=UPI0004B6BFAD|nr:UDP-N-acetylmuramoyl-tripeptide--D-alanyl-D-alanine ligase [Tropheryma whipplei]
MLIRRADIQRVTGGILHNTSLSESLLPINGRLKIDSRNISQGDIFVAHTGTKFDGHEFLYQAKQSGASLAIVTRVQEIDLPQLLVGNVTEAMHAIAGFKLCLSRDTITVIGITGSNGKTTTKSVLAYVLSKFGNTVATHGNQNNEIGFPITVSRIEPLTKYLVLEYGAFKPGDIDCLKKIAVPDIAVLLSAGHAHVEKSGSLESVCSMKAELARDLPEGSKVLLNYDDPRIARLSVGNRYYFGTDKRAHFRASHVETNIIKTRFIVTYQKGSVEVETKLIGKHQVSNVLAALSTLVLLGFDAEVCARYISEVNPLDGRMQYIPLGDFSIIHDAYNASFESVKCALDSLVVLGSLAKRRIAVLGRIHDMGELTQDVYRQLVKQFLDADINLLVIVSEKQMYLIAKELAKGVPNKEIVWFEDLETAKHEIFDLFSPGDIVLFKASNAENFSSLVESVKHKAGKFAG